MSRSAATTLCLAENKLEKVVCLKEKGHDGAHVGVRGNLTIGWGGMK